jgi:hypothetical protein
LGITTLLSLTGGVMIVPALSFTGGLTTGILSIPEEVFAVSLPGKLFLPVLHLIALNRIAEKIMYRINKFLLILLV